MINPPEPGFLPDPEDLSGSQKLSDFEAVIAAALGIGAEEFSLLINDTHVIPRDVADQLTLENLSRLYRHATLARALKLNIADYLILLHLRGKDPFTSRDLSRLDPIETLLFVEEVDAIEYSNISVTELDYLLRHAPAAAEALAPTDREIAHLLNDIRSGLQNIAAENTYSAELNDHNGELTAQKLALLNWRPERIEGIIATLNDRLAYEAELAALPDFPEDVEFPPKSLKNRIEFDEQRQRLIFHGVMSRVDKKLLQELAPNHSNYTNAIDRLFNASRHFLLRNLRTFSIPDCSTKQLSENLADFVSKLKFPEELKDRIYYDSATRTLHFRGIMSEQEKNMLLELSRNREYIEAVVYLFDYPLTREVPPEDRFFYSDDGIETLLCEGDESTPPARRFGKVLEKLLPHLKQSLGRQMVTQTLADNLGLEPRICARLLSEWLKTPGQETVMLDAFVNPDFAESNLDIPVTREAFEDQFNACLLLHKVALVIAKLEFSEVQLNWLFEHKPQTWPDLNDLSVEYIEDEDLKNEDFEKWLHLFRLCALRDALPDGESVLDRCFKLVYGALEGEDVGKRDLIDLLNTTLHWHEEDIKTLIGDPDDPQKQGLLNIAFPEGYGDETVLWLLLQCFRLLRRVGISASLCGDLCQPLHRPNDEDNNHNSRKIANQVVHAVRAKYEEERWFEVAKPLRDQLRSRQRDALIAYLVSHPADDMRFRDVNDLYAYFLIDSEMDPCMKTSRIKQAISSVQLFVQRCFMNLEKDVMASEAVDRNWRQWKWMKNYRVWEANRKIFLWPENWIEPELRDDKSPFFKELESELMQSNLTLETAARAMLNYLEKLDQVARLEIVGQYHQVEKDKAGNVAIDILHVFGRTPNIPHVYYYRRRIDSFYWTAWERVDLDIEGDHLIPVVWNRRLYLFWPIFTQKPKDEVQGSDKPLTEVTTKEIIPEKVWEIKLAWSEYQDGKWSDKKISTEFIEFDFYQEYQPPADKPESFFFRAIIDSNNDLSILLFQTRLLMGYIFSNNPIKAFRFLGCYSVPILGDIWAGNQVIYHPKITDNYFMYFRESENVKKNVKDKLFLPGTFDVDVGIFGVSDIVILEKTPGRYIILPHVSGEILCQNSFFFSNSTRTFFVEPIPKKVLGFEKGNQIDPGSVPDFGNMYMPEVQPPVELPDWVMSDSYDPPYNEHTIPSEMPTEAGLHPKRRAYAGAGVPGRGATAASRTAMTTAGSHPHYGMVQAQDINLNLDIVGKPKWWNLLRTEYHYRFRTFYHPFVCTFVRQLRRDGLDGLLQRLLQRNPKAVVTMPGDRWLDFENNYAPTEVVELPYPVEEVDFEYDGAYSIYNWELFFHVPLLIAERLKQNQRFEEAQKWFHYIFDPTDRSDESVPQRYWKTKPFFERSEAEYRRAQIHHILELLAREESDLSAEEREELGRLLRSVDRWRNDPFKPHLIAALRTVAYQKTVVMKYIENLIAWGDQLFRRDTIESINEATQLYILAAEILGRRPERIPPRATAGAQTYESLLEAGEMGEFSDPLVAIEEYIPPSAAPRHVHIGDRPDPTPTMLYFCPPKNEKLLGYWDIVADRLFKIRHCMTIEGVKRELPLFEPPIEPGLLVRAAAAGVDISSVLNNITGAMPHYRFNVMVQKATELCNEVKSLGSTLLAILEKRDAEALAQMRARHETRLLELVEEVKKQQLEEARQQVKNLRRSREVAVARYLHYQKLLGVQNPQVPAEGQPIPEQEASPHIVIKDQAGTKLIPMEKQEMELEDASMVFQVFASGLERQANMANLAPNVNMQPTGSGVTHGGLNIGAALSAFASYFRSIASQLGFAASRTGKLAQFAWRAHDWTLQSNLAAKEIMQIDKQIVAAEIRKAMAERELENHRRQMEQTKEQPCLNICPGLSLPPRSPGLEHLIHDEQ